MLFYFKKENIYKSEREKKLKKKSIIILKNARLRNFLMMTHNDIIVCKTDWFHISTCQLMSTLEKPEKQCFL